METMQINKLGLIGKKINGRWYFRLDDVERFLKERAA